ncbi:hypothetical protein Cgig2_005113 [Carnegiea gigantea]|uniref:non-specific serine/threonine protein kinase n=1 Tax=Carnegiea gigantea TaxID=171969 RepID=A0A9Q1L2A5_9CARY|nr:hypothetical protein Cgig2_005113 [Carnegiea gigantea]
MDIQDQEAPLSTNHIHFHKPKGMECGIIRPSNYNLTLGKELGAEQNNVKGRRSYSSFHCFSFEEIVDFTNNFDEGNLIGVGSYGKVYHGILLDGIQVVVKELFLSSVKAEEFRSMMEAIPNITHKNLVKMIGYCVKDWQPYARYILVSEYVDNGNLHHWLHEDEVGDISIPLSWRTRMNIISGIAKGLAYMHEDVDPKMVHGRLQSCKVLLDRHWNPKISEFAVGRVLGLKRRLFTDAGYMASEYAMAGEMDEKSDVYSFGILVMEIISGRKPIDHDRPKEEIQLVEWLKLMVSIQNYKQILDPRITQVPPLKELKRVLLIALRCVDLTPENRPKMGQVIHMLQPNDLLLSDVSNKKCQVFCFQ